MFIQNQHRRRWAARTASFALLVFTLMVAHGCVEPVNVNLELKRGGTPARPKRLEFPQDIHKDQMLKRGLPPAGPKRLVAGWKASWSPDATQLVFGKVGGPGLRILNLEDGQVTDLVDFGKDPAWSPDGRFIAFVKEPTPDAYLAEEVWLVKPTGQSPRKLADGGFLIWSRDSKRLYVHSRTENYIFSIEVDDPNGKPQVDEAIGSVAPEIEGEDIDGEPFKLSDYRGKVVVLDFWGDW